MKIEEIIKSVGEKHMEAEPRGKERIICNLVIIGDVKLNYRKKRRRKNK